MSIFGEMLRNFRLQCNDPGDPARKLTQERLGELLGIELGDEGFSGAAVSDWERGKSKIHADDRRVLVSLIKILQRQGGLKTLEEADKFLEIGNFRALNSVEGQLIFREATSHTFATSPIAGRGVKQTLLLVVERLFINSSEELKAILAQAEEGPAPSWPRILIALLSSSLEYLSVLTVLRVLTWFWIWLLTWRLLIPSLHWPFESHEFATLAIGLYVIGTVAIPLLIGILTNTKNNRFWQQHNLGDSLVTRLYTYQGAGIGFHLGYFAVFSVSLLGYYLHIPSAIWSDLIKAGFPLLIGYIGAQVIPYNLWHAYGRLNLADGGVFFLFWILGPLWGLFLWKLYEFVLDLTVGPFIILLAITILVMLMAQRKRQADSTVIPTHWWIIIYGTIAILYQISITKDLYSVVSLTALIVVLSVLFGLGRIHITLIGAIISFVVLGLLMLGLRFGPWVTSLTVGIIVLTWWRWGKRHLSLPISFLIVILIDIGCSWLLRHKLLSDIWASIVFGDITLLLLWVEHRLLNVTKTSSSFPS